MRPQTVVERLDFVAKRIPGLKFTPPTQLSMGDEQGYGCFMSCDMYYIEIKVDQSHQNVKDVIISHNSEGTSCPVLKKVLADQDFETFAKHLSGLHSIYQISTNDKKVKQRAYPALTALENDLAILYDHQRRRISNCHDLVHKSPIGIMDPRKGGLPVRLTYFITPYDLVDTTQKGLINLSINNIIDRNLGLSATVEIEGSNSHKLQVKSLISTQHSSSLPAYAPFNSQNSEKLPAQFVLKLSQPFPMLNTSIHQIVNEINEPTTIKEYLFNLTTNSKESIVSLIARQELDLNKGSFTRSIDLLKGFDGDSCDIVKHVYTIKLLDQNHTYRLLDHCLDRPEGVYVTKVPFTHPTSIPNILRILRQQALFNFVIGSCIRKNKSNSGTLFEENGLKSMQSPNNSIFDIIPVSLNNVCVSFEHPSRESLATLEIDFRDLSCQLYALDQEIVCSNEFATKTLQKCWSIPVTLRSVLKKSNERRLALLEDANRRREREFQELLANNSAQQGPQLKSHLHNQESVTQSKMNNLSDKSNVRDLNFMAEFLSSKMSNASTSNAPNQTVASVTSNRTNLIKKFSCKPKAKQNATTKSQTGNKILSLMLKRPNSSASTLDDTTLKATLSKKAKTKSTAGPSSKIPVTTTKLISAETASAARFASKQCKQQQQHQPISTHQNPSVSLIRSPNEVSSTPSSSTTINLVSQTSTSNPTINSTGQSTGAHSRVKGQSNGNTANKPRKGSINAVLDKLVGGLTPEQSTSANSSDIDSGFKTADSKGSPIGNKIKAKIQADQFAIKQGTSGGLKLTVTKTKPSVATSAPVMPTPTQSSSSTIATSVASSSQTPSISTQGNSTNTPSSISNSQSQNKTDANKFLGLGTSTSNIKYTIPKIPKAQQPAQSISSQPNSTDTGSALATNNNHSSNPSDESSSSNPTGSQTNISSSTNNKRTPSSPFNRGGTYNRNSVTSSTHPARTTSNPLANPKSLSSTGTSENHVVNRISSSNSSQQQGLRQPMISRVNEVSQQVVQPQAVPGLRMATPTLMTGAQQQPPIFPIGVQKPQQQTANLPLRPPLKPIAGLRQPLTSAPDLGPLNRMPSVGPNPTAIWQQPMNSHIPGLQIIGQQLPTAPNPVSNIQLPNLIMQTQFTQQPQFQPQQVVGQPSSIPVFGHGPTQSQPLNPGVSSSSDSSHLKDDVSTPSSPTECGQVPTPQAPTLIPIDSLEDPQSRVIEADHPDDSSDRLSIVDSNEGFADSNSTAGTPKSSSITSPQSGPSSCPPPLPNSSTSSTSTQEQPIMSSQSSPKGTDSINESNVSLIATGSAKSQVEAMAVSEAAPLISPKSSDEPTKEATMPFPSVTGGTEHQSTVGPNPSTSDEPIAIQPTITATSSEL